MTSLTQRTTADHNSSNQNPNFVNSSFIFGPMQIDMVSEPSMRPPHNFSDNVMPDFDGHFPFGKYQQDLPAWQASGANLSMHLLDQEKLIKSTASSYGNDKLLPGNNVEEASSCMGNLQNIKISSEDIGNLAAGNWGVGLDQNLTFSCMIPVSHANHLSGDRIREMAPVSRLGTKASGKESPSPVCSSPPTSALPFGIGIETVLDVTANWSTVDPSQGGLSIQGVNLAASPCLANFSSDPGFADRAARFSSFGSHIYSEFAPPFALTEGFKTYPKSCVRPSDKSTNKRTQATSCSNVLTSATSSPLGTATESHEPNCLIEQFSNGSATMEGATGCRCIEKGQGRPSTSAVPPLEGTINHGTLVNECHEADATSIGREESSSSERDACETVSQGRTDNPGKRPKNSLKDKYAVEETISVGKEEAKCVDIDEAKGKRHKSGEHNREMDEQKRKAEQSNSGNSADSAPHSVKENSKPPEAPKPDYIHVRAR
eukprot:c18664_g1_i1 orf=518-1981(+)